MHIDFAQPDILARILWRKKFWILVPLVAGLSLSYVAAKRIEPSYRATAVLLVESQHIRRDFVQETVTSTVMERIRQIQQDVTQDEILEPIIAESGLYSDLFAQGRASEALNRVRGSLKLQANEWKKTVEITFAGPDPRPVADVANRIGEHIIESNLRLRGSQTQATTTFVESEISEARRLLDEKSSEIASLKSRFDGRLPEQREENRRSLDRAERRLKTVEDDLQSAETRRLLLTRAGISPSDTETTARAPSRLDELRRELQQARALYTEKHPDVIRLENEIAALSAVRADPPEVLAPQEERIRDPLLNAEVLVIDQEIARLESERGQIVAEIDSLRRRLRIDPSLAQQLDNLESQHGNLQGFYDFLLKKQTEARLAENLEVRQQPERFSFLQKARAPGKPYSPNVLYLLIVGAILGGGLGLGLVVLREELDTTFSDPDALTQTFSGVRVLTVIPNLASEKLEEEMTQLDSRASA